MTNSQLQIFLASTISLGTITRNKASTKLLAAPETEIVVTFIAGSVEVNNRCPAVVAVTNITRN
jgi:hypothetical protein